MTAILFTAGLALAALLVNKSMKNGILVYDKKLCRFVQKGTEWK